MAWTRDWHSIGKANFWRAVTDDINNMGVCETWCEIVWCCHHQKRHLHTWKLLSLKWTFSYKLRFLAEEKSYRWNICFSASIVLRLRLMLFDSDDNSIYMHIIFIHAHTYMIFLWQCLKNNVIHVADLHFFEEPWGPSS